MSPNEFSEATDQANLVKIPFLGGKFTWSNNSLGSNFKQSGTGLLSMRMEEWIRRCPEARNEIFSCLSSDHASMIVTFSVI